MDYSVLVECNKTTVILTILFNYDGSMNHKYTLQGHTITQHFFFTNAEVSP